jgi:hypothetical protein
LGSKIASSEKIDNACKFFALVFVSVKKVLDKNPDFNLLSLVALKALLYKTSCFLKKSVDVAFCFIKKYSSWRE